MMEEKASEPLAGELAAAPITEPSESSGAPSGMGEHCVTDRPAPAGASAGEISKIANIDAYITKPAGYPQTSAKLLLYLTSGTGIHSKNNQLQADQYAAEGFVVVMPDQFGGDPAPNANTQDVTEPADASVIEQIKLRAAETVQSFKVDMWLARQTPEKVMPILRQVIDAIREEFADAWSYGNGLYAVGYCFGGKYVALLAAADTAPASRPTSTTSTPGTATAMAPASKTVTIKAGALAHGTMITKQDIEGIKAPLILVCVENDALFPDDIREAGRKHLEEEKIDHQISVFPKMPHGFATCGEYEDPAIQEAQKAAFKQMLEWLKAH